MNQQQNQDRSAGATEIPQLNRERTDQRQSIQPQPI